MTLEADKLAPGEDGSIERIHSHLCRTQLDQFEAALATGDDLLVGCTQEAPLFQEIAEEHPSAGSLHFVNIRETAGWTKAGENPHPKISALLTMARHEARPVRLKPVQSDGMCLIYGRDQAAVDVAQMLSVSLSVTLLLDNPEPLVLPPTLDFPVFAGTIAAASGSFGSFSVTVDGYAPMLPSSRGELQFAMPRDGASSTCSIILDCSDNAPLFAGHRHRDGYRKVDPGNTGELYRTAFELADMVGEFEKPIYVTYNGDICAHARSQKIGCSNCLDLCPAGAISEAGDGIAIDDAICGGCGSCHSRCPTGAISYQYPQATDFITQGQLALNSYLDAGGKTPVILLHDDTHGIPLIAAMARFGNGLPGHVIPLSLHAVTMAGHGELLALLSAGACAVIILADPRRADELTGLEAEVALSNHFAEALALRTIPFVSLVATDDPTALEAAVWTTPEARKQPPVAFQPVGSKRDLSRLVLTSLYDISPDKPGQVDLPSSAPYGNLQFDHDACTLCMACVSACPANALQDTPGEPKLRFVEASCVQCGICTATCPESALALHPRYNFETAAAQPQTLKEEEPFNCIECGTPFATQSTIAKIREQLAGQHTMFAAPERARVIEMCENCRVEALANSTDDPFAAANRPMVRTTQDYLDNKPLTSKDFLIDDD